MDPNNLDFSDLDLQLFFTLYSIMTPFDAFEISVFENIMENGVFGLLEKLK